MFPVHEGAPKGLLLRRSEADACIPYRLSRTACCEETAFRELCPIQIPAPETGHGQSSCISRRGANVLLELLRRLPNQLVGSDSGKVVALVEQTVGQDSPPGLCGYLVG